MLLSQANLLPLRTNKKVKRLKLKQFSMLLRMITSTKSKKRMRILLVIHQELSNKKKLRKLVFQMLTVNLTIDRINESLATRHSNKRI